MTEFTLSMLAPMKAEIFMALSGMALLVFGVLRGDKSAVLVSWLCTAVYVGAIYLLVCLMGSSDVRQYVTTLNDMFVFDAFAGIMKLLVLVGLIFSTILSLQQMRQENVERFEYPLLMLFSGLGMMLMISAHDLLALYMGLELQSLALYVLASIRRENSKSAEAGLKYFVLGAISSGMLLFGASLIYGYTGSTNFAIIGDSLMNANSVGAMIGMVFLIAGLAFKISAVPFHMWTPDVYEGAPTSVTAFFAMVPKIAAMALIIRLLFEAFPPEAVPQWQQIVWILSLLSMTVGAFAALLQDNLKRLLAYSSIGNMGFALVGLVAATQDGVAGIMIYMMIYMAMTAATFGIVLSMQRDGKSLEQISDLSGLSRNHPVMAYVLAIMMFSMSGIPPLAGFFGKFLVFKAAIGADFYVLAILGVLCSVVAAYYYLRIIKVMFFDEPVAKFDAAMPFARKLVIGVCTGFVILFVFYPSNFVLIATEVAYQLVHVKGS